MHKHMHAASRALCTTLLKHHSLHFDVFLFCSKNKTIFHALLALSIFNFPLPLPLSLCSQLGAELGVFSRTGWNCNQQYQGTIPVYPHQQIFYRFFITDFKNRLIGTRGFSDMLNPKSEFKSILEYEAMRRYV